MEDETLNSENGTKVIKADDFVFLNDGAKRLVIRASQIATFEVDGNYTMVHLNDATSVLITRSLIRLERRLDPSTFFRASRACIVNLACVKQIKPCGRRQFIFVLTDGKHVELSRRRTMRFQKENAL